MLITHHGEALKRYLRLNDITVKVFMDKVSKSRQAIYDWFEKERFDQELLDRVIQKGGVPEEIFTKPYKKQAVNPADIVSEPKQGYFAAGNDRELLKMAMDILVKNTEYLQQELHDAQQLIAEHVRRTDSKIATIEGYIVKRPKREQA